MDKKRCLLIVAAAVLLLAPSCETVNFPPFGTVNYPPIITSLEAEADWTAPSGSLQVTCTASDRDRDELSYEWSTTGGNISGTGCKVIWTAPEEVGVYDITVVVDDGHDSKDTESVTIIVGNKPPTIASLVADADWTTPSGSIQVTCTASDPDGDELSYEWSTTGGDISGTGHEVIWTAPEEVGIYDITVVVNDGQGGNDTGSVTLIAATGTLPIIENLIVTAKEPKYLKETSDGYKVGKGKEYDIECISSNTSGELGYEWLCDGGEISGEGSMITWTAPDTEGDVTVTVIVFDDVGYMDSKSIVFEVVPCSSCTFG